MRTNILLALWAFIAIGCQHTNKQFLLTDNSVGEFPKDSLIGSLERIYKDFEVERPLGKSEPGAVQAILIREKNEAKSLLLEITPQKNLPEKIASIEVLDARFKTEKGISLSSTFADIKKVYTEIDIEPSFYSVVIMPKNTNIYFTISKEALSPSPTGTFSEADIPEAAKISRLMINWQ